MKIKESSRDISKEENVTYDEYATINDERYELVRGQLEVMSPSTSTTHQLINAEIYKRIEANCLAEYFIFYAPIDVILCATDVRQPNIVLVNRKRMNILTNRGIEGAPDLVIEIFSPTSLKRDKIDKLKTDAEYNIPEYWMIDPISRTLKQYVLATTHYEIINIFQRDEVISSSKLYFFYDEESQRYFTNV